MLLRRIFFSLSVSMVRLVGVLLCRIRVRFRSRIRTVDFPVLLIDAVSNPDPGPLPIPDPHSSAPVLPIRLLPCAGFRPNPGSLPNPDSLSSGPVIFFSCLVRIPIRFRVWTESGSVL
jgi:hypothetical protein